MTSTPVMPADRLRSLGHRVAHGRRERLGRHPDEFDDLHDAVSHATPLLGERMARRLPRGARGYQRCGGSRSTASSSPRAEPRVRRLLDGRGRRRRLAHELLERGDDRGGLVGRGAGGDELELRAPVRHRAAAYTLPRRAPAARPRPRRRPRRRLAARGDRRRARRVRPAPPRRVGDAVEGLPRLAAARRLPRDAGARRRPGDPEVDLVVPVEPREGAADGDRGAGGQRRDDVRAAGADGRRRGDGAADGRGGGGGGRRAGGGPARGDRRLRAARRVGGALPGRGRLRAGRLLRPRRRRARRRWPSELGWTAGSKADALAQDVVCCVTPGHEIVVEAGDLHAGPAPQHARRRRAGEGRGDRRRRRVVRAVLRRVGPGLARRRADRRGRGRASSRASRSPTSAPCSPARRRGGRAPRR